MDGGGLSWLRSVDEVDPEEVCYADGIDGDGCRVYPGAVGNWLYLGCGRKCSARWTPACVANRCWPWAFSVSLAAKFMLLQHFGSPADLRQRSCSGGDGNNDKRCKWAVVVPRSCGPRTMAGGELQDVRLELPWFGM